MGLWKDAELECGSIHLCPGKDRDLGETRFPLGEARLLLEGCEEAGLYNPPTHRRNQEGNLSEGKRHFRKRHAERPQEG